MMYGNLELEHVITDVEENYKGKIIGYKLEDGTVISKYEAIQLSKQGAIAGVTLEMLEKRAGDLQSLSTEDINVNLWNLDVLEQG
ncbi:DUF3892 domain-containing protein [Clostridium aestuarii]|uniref:DUF3892 domain-containing protein n=1 Tax=Clostridium aestuarii TaxID=338193 RepID=A0ABT4CZP9_9CLOT|nr:DUF3892 domain-containing protein [Clostridium aestuarii]MCY6484459.1 DUF3892 domain-containing protein [Clostridium aestuarii]